MKNINYKIADGTIQKIEVTDEFAVAYEEIEKQSYREEERHKWEIRKHITSLDSILDSGGQIGDDRSDFSEIEYRYEDLHNAIAKLTTEQQWLLKELYFYGKTNCSVAKDLGITETAVRHRLISIFKKIKTFL